MFGSCIRCRIGKVWVRVGVRANGKGHQGGGQRSGLDKQTACGVTFMSAGDCGYGTSLLWRSEMYSLGYSLGYGLEVKVRVGLGLG